MLYDWLIVGQVCQISSAQAVRGPKLVIHKGSTPVLSDDQVRQLFVSIDTHTLVGLRDRALIGMMLCTFGRVGAVVAMLVEDYYPGDKRWFIRLHERGGKRHEMPVHSVLEQYLDAYLKEGRIADAKRTPHFRSANRPRLTASSISVNTSR